jgi:hypothetical protein
VRSRRVSSFAAAWVVVGCGHPAPDGASSLDRRPRGARTVWLDPFEGQQRGEVDTSAGDRTDWLYVEMPGLGGGPVDLRLRIEPDGPLPSNVAVAIYDAEGATLGTFAPAGEDVLTASLVAPPELPGFYVVIYAVGWDDAAAYQLDVAHEPANPPPIDVELIEPLPAVPTGHEDSREAFDPEYDRCAPRYDDKIVYCNPPPQPDPWAPPERPTEARIVDAEADGDGTALILGLGSEGGLSSFDKLRIRGIDAEVTIKGVGRRSTRARVDAPLDDVLASSLIVDINPR